MNRLSVGIWLAVLSAGWSHAIVLNAPCGKLELDDTNGSIRSVSVSNSAASVWNSGADGLWKLTFADNTTMRAADFSGDHAIGKFQLQSSGESSCLLAYESPKATVRIVIEPAPDKRGFDFRATVGGAAQPVLTLDLPCELQFSPDDVQRFVFPQNGNESLGVAWNDSFFRDHTDMMDAGWETKSVGPRGYNNLYYGALNYRDVNDPPVPVSVTEEGTRWFSAEEREKLSRHTVVANRAPCEGQYNRVLLNTEHGPFFSSFSCGGRGSIWRFGGPIFEDYKELATTSVNAVLSQLAAERTGKRKAVAIITLQNGPKMAGWSNVSVEQWKTLVQNVAKKTKAEFRAICSPQDVTRALADPGVLSILNPYGEILTVDPALGYDRMIDAIRSFVQSGGNWFETAAFSFHYQFEARRFHRYSVPYPPAFADFMQLDSRNGAAAVYRVQPRVASTPWEWTPDNFFLPGSLWCAGDERGGCCGHAFSAYIQPGASHAFPVVRMALGQTTEANLKDYAVANALTRKLSEKVKPDVLEKLKQAPLLKLNSPANDLIRYLPQIPSPSLIHFSDYLKGGFDKEYPDHLPPNKWFGTEENLKKFFQIARAKGHLVSPYTNPTWWCDHPKGPSFATAGDDPLLKTLDGKPRHEQYGKNDGWTITYWHPDVRKANRKTVREFTHDYPVDLLFQDQCGARKWHYDTNPASPNPAAYVEGMLHMNDEDSRIVPIGTENGWDRTANFQTMICGMSWGHVPTPWRTWQWYFKEHYSANTWEMYPLALYLFHENCIFTHHDLGQFVMPNRYDTLVWTLATGYGLSFASETRALVVQESVAHWYDLLSHLQKSVCARYIGQPLLSFQHDRTPLFARKVPMDSIRDDGVIRAQFGPVKILANLGDVPRELDGHPLAPYGFWIEEPGKVTASYLDGKPITITEGGSAWEWNPR